MGASQGDTRSLDYCSCRCGGAFMSPNIMCARNLELHLLEPFILGVLGCKVQGLASVFFSRALKSARSQASKQA